MLTQATIQKSTENAQIDTHDIRDPVLDVRTAVKAGLDYFNDTAEGTCADEDGQ